MKIFLVLFFPNYLCIYGFNRVRFGLTQIQTGSVWTKRVSTHPNCAHVLQSRNQPTPVLSLKKEGQKESDVNVFLPPSDSLPFKYILGSNNLLIRVFNVFCVLLCFNFLGYLKERKKEKKDKNQIFDFVRL